MPTQEDQTPGCVAVARFLQHIVPIRQGLLNTVLDTPKADADRTGMAVFAEVEENNADIG